ncbi:hypothetical protein [Chryseobacterium sp.]|uniref:hypothetical protein n=1 Tax=Chryseobacterium sp. TaxID=1871047 RepID=UPI0028A1EB0A|nr:hypothetical protein [Chryseobacterium sp.]
MLSLQSRKLKISTISALGSYLVLYTSLIPFSNNIIEALYPATKTTIVLAANNNLSAVIWSLGMCIQPVIFFILNKMKPYIWSYSLPLFSSLYSTAFYFLPLFGVTPKEDKWFFASIISIVIIAIGVMKGLSIFIKVLKTKELIIRNALKEYTQEN